MGEDKEGDVYSTKWFRSLVIAALLSGIGGGYNTLSKTDDRYRGSEARADFAVRDRSIESNATRINNLELAMSGHLQHSAQYTQIILDIKRRFEATAHPPARVEALLKDYEERLRDLEKHK